jgi:dephospho-CoA kinase
MAFVVGLTGGIGSGKSSVADMLRELGAAVVDTDVIARELTQAGGRAIGAIRDAFGAECIAPDGGLERAAMRRLVFRDPAAKARLEAILHPLIRAESRARLAAARGPYVIVVVPLLFETGAYEDIVDRVLVVDCAEDEQVRRTIGRSGLQEEEVRAIMAAQLPRAARLERADDVLHNDKGMEALREQVLELHAKYLTLARP